MTIKEIIILIADIINECQDGNQTNGKRNSL